MKQIHLGSKAYHQVIKDMNEILALAVMLAEGGQIPSWQAEKEQVAKELFSIYKECHKRVQGNRGDMTRPSWADMKLICLGVLEEAKKILEAS